MPHTRQIARATAVFRALAVAARIRIIRKIAAHGELFQKQLLVTGASQPTISRHLAYLERAGVIEKRRDGRFAYWRLRRLPEDVRELLRTLIDTDAGSAGSAPSRTFEQAPVV